MSSLVAFLLIALRVWDNQGSFDATIQSGLIGGVGFVQRKLQSTDLKPEDIDKLIDNELAMMQTTGAASAAATAADPPS